jgi:NADH-quinone oxidoreductase subunit L
MRNMGGLRTRMPVTFWTYLIGTLALAGIFPLAGFWSKDEILAKAFSAGFNEGKLEGYIALGLLLMAAGFTQPDDGSADRPGIPFGVWRLA